MHLKNPLVGRPQATRNHFQPLLNIIAHIQWGTDSRLFDRWYGYHP